MAHNQSGNLTKPTIKRAIGTVMPGTGYVVGGGAAQSVSVDDLVGRAAVLLRELYNRDVEIRFNSHGHSGGAYLVTDSSPDAVLGNGNLGICVSEFSVSQILKTTSREHVVTLGGDPDGPDKFTSIKVRVQEFLLKDSSLATNGSVQFGNYAYLLQPSLEAALHWLKDQVNLDALNSAHIDSFEQR